VQATAIYRASVIAGTVAVGFSRVDDTGVEDFAMRYAAATGWTGFLSFDFIRDAAGQAFAIECNPRLTSGVHFFETDDLAPAVLNASATLRLRDARELQQFWSCLQEAQGTLPNVFAFAGRLRAMSRRRDVTFASNDPAPLLTMPWTARELLRRAARERVPMAVAASADIGWSPLAEQILEAA
jgi:predicted ATP-grasp superfamily ATP-dependent carboligase